ncbi:LamG-like jellyroll fold domain-containing protein [Anaerostipes sp.]|uniref:LamG-like jellyroll fold domain-containing protein n=1 Tax=Anaerostipes sp. TaxID=1872530 RepID=UPI0025BCE6DA|nr:LamG-like jellyroll fold domain-containing protein [Anaerostipes sp.]MBS7009030.1 fibronectin type III domain-containing protein [Anaerostipes sp.]
MKKSQVLAVMMSAVVISSSMPVQNVFAGESARQAAVKNIVKTNETQNKALDNSEDEILAKDYEEAKIPEADNIRGNITLKTETSNGTKVSWKSSDESVISTKEVKNDNYDSIPAGVVKRPADGDKNVTLTAVFTRNGKSTEKSYNVTVKKAAKKLTESDMKGYFFTYFAGEGYSDGEQIYFASSRDGLNWVDLNENKPVLTSDKGEKGVRDPYIIRSHEGDKFYMIATDLKINGGNGWGAAQSNGSKSLMIWESEDLVNWSDMRMVKVNSDKAGCTWAPEATYDEKTGEYIVYWASKTSDDNYGKQKLYYSKTRDFYTFTEPKVFIDKDQSSIDTTITYNEADGMYYRYTKNEGGTDNEVGAKTKTIFIERSKTLLGGKWEHIPSDSLNANQWVEGPTMFKFIGQNKWCLLLDNFGGGGYYPVVTDNLSGGVFTKPEDSYKMPSRARHGTPIQITSQEYNAVMKKWGDGADEKNDESKQAPIKEYNFENGAEDITLKSNAKIEKDTDINSNVLKLDGTDGTFAQLPKELFEGRNKMTISMDVKPEMDSGAYFTFGLGKSNQKYMFLKLAGKQVKSVITRNTWSGENGVDQNLEESTKGKWQNVKIVFDGMKMQVYVDNVLTGTNENTKMTISELGENLSAYLGKSFYDGDKYFNGSFDNIKIYNRAFTEKEVRNETELKTLKEMADGVRKLNSNKYTEESYAALQAAVSKLESLTYPSEADQKAAEEAFYSALSGLEIKGDSSYTSGLKIVIQAAEKIKQQGYTKASYDQLQNALKSAKEAAKNPSLTKNQAAVHITAIQKSMDGLKTVQVPKVTSLKSSSNKATSLKLSWKKASGVSSYELYRYNSSKKKYNKIKTLSASAASYSDKKLKSGTSYTYKIRVKKIDGGISYYGSYTALKTATAPGKVTGLKVRKASKTKIKLNWKKVKGASGYAVYMKTGSGKYKRVKTITKGSTVKYTKTKLKKGKKYTFKIRAYKKADKTIYGSYSSSKNYKIK